MIASKTIKCLRVYLTKVVKELNSKNYEMMTKEFEEINTKVSHVHGLE